jgi:2-polyprenyl-3-methyl-5-hydroxy-6-metoxy-1,4-benzoquinol methylase
MAKTCRWDKEWTHNGITVIDCQSCGFKHQHPIPSAESVATLYRDQYYQSLKPGYLKAVTGHSPYLSLWVQTKKTMIARLCPALCDKVHRSILDIGASAGHFLKPFAEDGWRTVGVEPSVAAAHEARKIPGLILYENLMENLSDAELDGPFDVVHIREVLNHLRDPVELLRRIHDRLLTPDGLFIVETANDFNPLQDAMVRLNKDVRWWITPDHICYFDISSLRAVLERTGFDIAHAMATFPIEMFPLMGENYRADPAMGKACAQRRTRFDLNMNCVGAGETWLRLGEAFAAAGVGRSSLFFARKA